MQIYFIDPNAPDTEISEALYRRMMRKRQSLDGCVLTAAIAAAVGLLYVELSDPPPFDSSTQKLVKTNRVPVSGNTFSQGWEVVPLSAEELDAHAAALVQKLVQAKASKKADLTEDCARADRSCFEFDGRQIAVDDASMRRVNGTSATVSLLGIFPEGWPGGWRAMDNTLVEIADTDTWKEFIRAMGRQGATNHARMRLLKTQVDACTTLSQVAAINW